jgi:hypothetical protein
LLAQLSQELGICSKTVAKWHKRATGPEHINRPIKRIATKTVKEFSREPTRAGAAIDRLRHERDPDIVGRVNCFPALRARGVSARCARVARGDRQPDVARMKATGDAGVQLRLARRVLRNTNQRDDIEPEAR